MTSAAGWPRRKRRKRFATFVTETTIILPGLDSFHLLTVPGIAYLYFFTMIRSASARGHTFRCPLHGIRHVPVYGSDAARNEAPHAPTLDLNLTGIRAGECEAVARAVARAGGYGSGCQDVGSCTRLKPLLRCGTLADTGHGHSPPELPALADCSLRLLLRLCIQSALLRVVVLSFYCFYQMQEAFEYASGVRRVEKRPAVTCKTAKVCV